MANKYIVSGCSFCGKGDGPLIPTEVAHNDASGYAWGLTSTDTDAINIFSGATPKYGTAIANGDMVYIRSKTASGTDITVNHTGIALGKSATTYDNTVTWILDGGSIWSGIDGSLTFINSTSAVGVTIQNFNNVIAENKDKIRITPTYLTGSSNYYFFQGGSGSICKNLYLDNTGSYSGGLIAKIGVSKGTLINPTIKTGCPTVFDTTPGAYATSNIFNMDLELTSASAIYRVFTSAGQQLNVYGGRVWGAGAISGRSITSAVVGQVTTCYGLVFPYEMTFSILNSSEATSSTSSQNIHIASSYGADGAGGASLVTGWGYMDSRNDGYYPKLNAVFPDSVSTKWVWKIYPANTYSITPMKVPISKLYTGPAASKTVTVEFLWPAAFAAANTSNIWLELSYTDDVTGEIRAVSSQTVIPSNFVDSEATWTSNSYSATLFTPKKFAVTTPTSIKQNTIINAVVLGTIKSINPSDILFIDPDMQLS